MTSLIITSYMRSNLLYWGLRSIINTREDLEIIVVNDGRIDETEKICNELSPYLNIKYIFTGQRNKEIMIRRSPSISINVGVKNSKGDILILSCAEMLHLNNCIKFLSDPIKINKKIITTTNLKDDDSTVLKSINDDSYDPNLYFEQSHYKLNNKLPFLLGISRDEFEHIGGYDEDFIGTDFDDNDFSDRLILDGCKYFTTEAKAIHLFHPRKMLANNSMSIEEIKQREFNRKLYQDRKGTIIRNQNRRWGEI